MLKLKSYSFSGIGRFVEKQTIDLENRDHLIQIDGENTNTGGSSGAGKSTTVEALAYLLGISEIPSTQLQSRITKSPIWVQGIFDDGITITRSKKEGLTIQTPEETVSGNSKLAEEKLDQIIGVNRKLLKTMCYKRQKQGGFFLNLTPKESHEFLIDCLDLGQYQSKINKMGELLKDKYKPKKIELESSIVELTNTVEQFEDLLKTKEKPNEPEKVDLDTIRLKIDVLKQKRENEEKAYQESLSKIGPKPIEPESPVFDKEQMLLDTKSSITAVKAEIEDVRKAHQEAIDQARSAVNKIQGNIAKANSYKQLLIDEVDRNNALIEQIKHIQEEKCPTCMREWKQDSGDKLKDLIAKSGMHQEKIAGYKSEIENIPHLMVLEQKAIEILEKRQLQQLKLPEKETLAALEENLRKLQNEKDNIKSVAKQQYLEEFNKWNQQSQFIESEFKKKDQELSYEIYGLENQLEIEQRNQEHYKKALETYKNDIDIIQIKTEAVKTKLENNSECLQDIEKNITLSEESIRLIRNFTLQKFQDTLDYIGQRATEIINMIPNMANAVIFFESAKETKTGKVKNEVNAVINLEGDTAIPIKTLSGGERTSADFAIDLAVGEMIESMTQKGVNFLIIDEGFDGLDSISKIECLEILKQLNTEKKILIVDHSSEVKEMVHDIIKVKRVNEESFVV
jgi:DNA repair exonuclease SbcCD ATPase subunit